MAKADAIETDKRIRTVQEWIIDDWPAVDIVKQAMLRWAVSDRQAKRYIATARDRWNEEEDKAVGRKRQVKIQSLRKLKRSLQERFKGTPQGIHAIMAVEKELIKLEGLELAQRHEHSGPDGGAIPTETTHRVIFEDYSKPAGE